ncbi:uncharacterized protein V1513DRAFT_453352 [Lipomyces chichibuensis]|uniref:uncharacterized protein n=1 Tax=Lipomyces chichibuensis TaxID=1546026 RepID=UPI0033438829
MYTPKLMFFVARAAHIHFVSPRIHNAWSCNRLPKTIGPKVLDFIPGEDWETVNATDSSFSLDGDYMFVYSLPNFPCFQVGNPYSHERPISVRVIISCGSG